MNEDKKEWAIIILAGIVGMCFSLFVDMDALGRYVEEFTYNFMIELNK